MALPFNGLADEDIGKKVAKRRKGVSAALSKVGLRSPVIQPRLCGTFGQIAGFSGAS